MLHTLDEAKRLSGAFVYGLSDGKELFYVGATTRPSSRFSRYLNLDTKNNLLNRRLKQVGDNVRVVVLEQNPRDLKKSELDFIMLNSLTVLNRIGSRFPRCALCGKSLGRTTQKRFCKPRCC